MDYRIEYYKDIDTDPKIFLQRFRCTTEPIGGSTELDEQGELVDWDAAVVAIDIAKKQFIEKACEWLMNNVNDYIINDIYLGGDWYKVKSEMFDDFRKEMEE